MVASFPFDAYKSSSPVPLRRYLFDCRGVSRTFTLVTCQRFEKFIAVLVIRLIARFGQRQEHEVATDFYSLKDDIR